MQRSIPRGGFTLIELLVVVTIIVVLAAMMVPGLETAVAQAKRTRCAANLKGIGNGLSLYLSDSHRFYPTVAYWHGLLGKFGKHEPGQPDEYPFVLGPEQRPLNPYLGYSTAGPDTPVPIAECPSDQGDSYWGSRNAYDTTGTSYVGPIDTSLWAITELFGWPGVPAMGVPANAPLQGPQIEAPSAKVAVADWNVYGNREYAWPTTRWHNPDPTQRQFNTLFADMHVEYFLYPLDKIDNGHGVPWNTPATPSNGFY